MPHAVTHILVAIIIADLFRDYVLKDTRRFPLHYVLIAGIAGLLPDIDVIAYWFLNLSYGAAMESVHRVFTHSFFIPIIILIIGLIVWKTRLNISLGKKTKLGHVIILIAFGYFIHVALDFLIVGMVYPFWPLSTMAVGLNIISYAGLGGSVLAGIDAILLVLWLIHEEMKHKISDYF